MFLPLFWMLLKNTYIYFNKSKSKLFLNYFLFPTRHKNCPLPNKTETKNQQTKKANNPPQTKQTKPQTKQTCAADVCCKPSSCTGNKAATM